MSLHLHLCIGLYPYICLNLYAFVHSYLSIYIYCSLLVCLSIYQNLSIHLYLSVYPYHQYQFYVYTSLSVYPCFQTPCDNLRTPSTYPGNMLPHHPGQGNFEDFTCWETQEHPRDGEQPKPTASEHHRPITTITKRVQPNTMGIKLRSVFSRGNFSAEHVKEILPQTPRSPATADLLTRAFSYRTSQPLAAGPWCLYVHSDCSKQFSGLRRSVN